MNMFRTHAEKLGVCTAGFLGALEHLLLNAQSISAMPGYFYENLYRELTDEIEMVKRACVDVVKAAMQRETLGEDWFYGFSNALPTNKLERPFYQTETNDTEVSATIASLVKALFSLLDLSENDKHLFLEIRFDGNRNSFEVTNRLSVHNPYGAVCDDRTRVSSANISDLQSLVDYGSEKFVIAISFIVDGMLFVDSKKINHNRENCKKLLFDLRKQMSPHLFHTTKISSNGEVQRAGYDPLTLNGKELQLFSYIYQESSANRIVTTDDAASVVYAKNSNGKNLISKLKNKVNSKIKEIGLEISNVCYKLISIEGGN